MSREVRRVPVDWQHPTEHNPHWLTQQQSRRWRGDPESRLHGPTERFVSLLDDYPGAVKDWEEEGAELARREGFNWTWYLAWCLTGYERECTCCGETGKVHPFVTEDDETVTVRDAEHLMDLLTERHKASKPNPAHYLPVFEGDDLGWVLYQTVSEGTPVTPVFATAAELVDYLATEGQDWGQKPMRRAAAEALVRDGATVGSFVSSGDGALRASDQFADDPFGTGEAPS